MLRDDLMTIEIVDTGEANVLIRSIQDLNRNNGGKLHHDNACTVNEIFLL